jgi:hypothetical protein
MQTTCLKEWISEVEWILLIIQQIFDVKQERRLPKKSPKDKSISWGQWHGYFSRRFRPILYKNDLFEKMIIFAIEYRYKMILKS